MLEKIIKKMHKKVAFSLYGFLEILVLIMPLIVIGFGVFFVLGENNNGYFWIVIGLGCMLFSIRKFKDLFGIYKYIFSPKKYPLYQNLLKDGVDINSFDKELEEADVVNNLSKNNPVYMTENFIFGFSQVSFFAIYKESVLWCYEYNGNGIVFYDKNKFYGFTYYPNVDGNDELIERLKKEMPYIYLGTDFDYKTIMHDNFDDTVIMVKNEREEFLKNPTEYIAKKEEEERIRALEEEKRLEEEKNKELHEIEENSKKYELEGEDSNNESDENSLEIEVANESDDENNEENN